MSQEITVFVIVGMAVAYLGRMFWRTFTSRRACGGCGGSCGGKVTPNAAQNAPQQLVQIQMNVRPKK